MKKQMISILTAFALAFSFSAVVNADNAGIYNNNSVTSSLKQFLLSSSNSDAQDVNKDGKTDIFDLMNLKQAVLDRDVPDETFDLKTIPAYTGSPYCEVNGNKPYFRYFKYSETFEYYTELDELGRCGTTIALLGKETMPTEPRGEIGMVKPTGWHTYKYDCISDIYLYNRCHLIGYQLSSENANVKNLITGTRYMNVTGMEPFESKVASYIKSTGNHVLYRTTPIFDGDNLVAHGVLMEAYSFEDKGVGICFNIFCYNVQPEIGIDYATGESWYEGNGEVTEPSVTTPVVTTVTLPETTVTTTTTQPVTAPPVTTVTTPAPVTTVTTKASEIIPQHPSSQTYVLNTNTKKFHYPECGSVKQMSEKNKKYVDSTRDSIIAQGYSPCKNCNP